MSRHDVEMNLYLRFLMVTYTHAGIYSGRCQYFKSVSVFRYTGQFLPARRSKHGICYGNVSGWLGGCPLHAGIVSKRLNLSENFFDHLKAPSF